MQRVMRVQFYKDRHLDARSLTRGLRKLLREKGEGASEREDRALIDFTKQADSQLALMAGAASRSELDLLFDQTRLLYLSCDRCRLDGNRRSERGRAPRARNGQYDGRAAVLIPTSNDPDSRWGFPKR